MAHAAPAIAAGAPFLVMLVTLAVQRPAITAYGDRAVTALEVRDLLRGHQLLGAYSRFGWHHPGPAFLLPLAAADVVLGGAHWALDAGMLAAGAVVAAALVLVVGRAAGAATAIVAAGILGLYVRSVGASVLRDPWNPWATLLAVALLTVLCGAAGAGSVAALAGSVLVASVIVQTHLAAAPVALGLLVTAGVLAGWARRRGAGPGRVRSPWRRPSAWVPLALAGAIWVPPLIQEATGSDPNLTDLWRFFVDGHPGHNLATTVGAVGDRLGQFPLGSPAHFLTTWTDGGWNHAGGSIATVAAYLGAGAALAFIGHRRQDDFVRALGVLTVVAVITGLVAVHTAEGPLQGFVIGWVTAIPIGCWVGVVALVAGWTRPRLSRSAGDVPALAVAAAIAVLGLGLGTGSALAAPSAAGESAPDVSRAWAQLSPRLAGRPAGAVLLAVDDQSDWPVQAGLALEVEEHGWKAHVADNWVFMFGPARRETGSETLVATVHHVATGGTRLTVSTPLRPDALRAAAAHIASVLGAP
ncbi:MAG TPA: hypothetical protein VGI06_02140 [Acidimicrobiales bacterium]